MIEKSNKIKSEGFYRSHRVLILFVIFSLLVLVVGMAIRLTKAVQLRQETNQDALTTVAVFKAAATPAIEKVVLPGDVRAWHEGTLYPRISGYIKTWKHDIGSSVKKGDVLALIETPDLDAQLRQAKADLQVGMVNAEFAQTTADRWATLVKTNSVSAQQNDEKAADARAKKALVMSLKANRDRLQELVDYKRIVAPFDGVITSRTIDIGSFITENSTNQLPLFQIVQANPLRVYVKIPQSYALRLSPKMTVDLYFDEYPRKIFKATLLDTAKAIDSDSRTLLAQFKVENKKYEILPGSYAQVHFDFPSSRDNVILPVNTLLFRKEGAQVATLNKNHKIVLKSIKIIRDFGKQVEVDAGIRVGETVVINPSDSLFDGQQVRVVDLKERPKDGPKMEITTQEKK